MALIFIWYYTLMIPLMMSSVILWSTLLILLSNRSEIGLLWQQLELTFWQEIVDWGWKWILDFNVKRTQLVSFARSNKKDAIDVKIHGTILDENPSFKMLGLFLSSKYWIGALKLSILLKLKNIRGLIWSMKFFSSEVGLYLCKSNISFTWNTDTMCG